MNTVEIPSSFRLFSIRSRENDVSGFLNRWLPFKESNITGFDSSGFNIKLGEQSMSENLLVIDGREVVFEPGQTILEAAEKVGIDIPTLCHLKGTTPTGACRVCMVEVEGARSLMAACTVPAAKGMVVRTESPIVIQSRKTTIELMLASGKHDDCLVCPASGDCRLQELAYKYQVKSTRFPDTECPYPMEAVNPLILRNFSKCVLCGRCVQACRDIQVNDAIDFGYRGAKTKIVAKGDMALKDRKSTRLNSSHNSESRMPSSA
jgi:NADH dehydrogenase/NADH:ubiquinone oxidoreductase subunit G